MAIDIVARALAVSGKQSLENYYTKTESDAKYSQATNLENGTGTGSLVQTGPENRLNRALGQYSNASGRASKALQYGCTSRGGGNQSGRLKSNSDADNLGFNEWVQAKIDLYGNAYNTFPVSFVEGDKAYCFDGVDKYFVIYRDYPSSATSFADYIQYDYERYEQYAQAEGDSVKALGRGAHAEGCWTNSLNFATHSEGFGTKAFADYSHAEGHGTESNGVASHAEGIITKANGINSHAEGYNTKSEGNNAHAEGDSSTSSGISAHAEGAGTLASNYASHSEGESTVASGIDSHAEGKQSRAQVNFSHAEGFNTIAGDPSLGINVNIGPHAEGLNTKATGYAAHAEGNSSIASGYVSHAQGENTVAAYSYQSVCGVLNDNKLNTLLEVGNGASETDRKNAFEVLKDGRAKVQSAPTEDDDVVRLLEVAPILSDYVDDTLLGG